MSEQQVMEAEKAEAVEEILAAAVEEAVVEEAVAEIVAEEIAAEIIAEAVAAEVVAETVDGDLVAATSSMSGDVDTQEILDASGRVVKLLSVGQEVPGTVKRLTEFGAFIPKFSLAQHVVI